MGKKRDKMREKKQKSGKEKMKRKDYKRQSK